MEGSPHEVEDSTCFMISLNTPLMEPLLRFCIHRKFKSSKGANCACRVVIIVGRTHELEIVHD